MPACNIELAQVLLVLNQIGPPACVAADQRSQGVTPSRLMRIGACTCLPSAAKLVMLSAGSSDGRPDFGR